MKKYIVLFLTGCIISLNTFSQSIGVTDFMRLNPYASLSNPAYFIPYNGYVGIPGAANINFNMWNTSLIYNNLVETDKNWKPINFTPNKFIKSLHPTNNWFNTNLDLEILGFGFRIKQHFFTFGYRIKMDEQFRYNKDLFAFLLQGNLAQDNNGDYLYTAATPADIAIQPNFNVYQEMSIGFQTQIGKRLYIGARSKMLFGLVNIKTDRFGAKVYSDPIDYTIYGNFDANINVASAVPFYTKDANGDIKLDLDAHTDVNWRRYVANAFSKNLGFAIDLGATYRITQRLRVSAAVTDLGFINWKGTPLNITSKQGEWLKFEGLNANQITDVIENGFSSLLSLDSLFHIVNNNFELNAIKSYNTMLTSKVMLDASFDLTPSNRFIVQFKGYIMGKHFLPQFTVTYNGTFFNAIDVVVSYSMMRNSFDNLGLGLGFRMGPVHLYFGTDNLLAAANVFNIRKANVTAGLLVNFPIKRIQETDLRIVVNEERLDN